MRRLLALLVLVAAPAFAADRHVYLNSTGGGSQLNDCPNPAHNAKGTSNTDELEYCAGNPTATHAGKIIGTVTGTVSAATCTGAADNGVVTPVTNGVSADVDRDGTNEVVYGHPQACVYNMARSDSCEVHAGRYATPGAQCDGNCGSDTPTYDWNNFLASVLAYGYFADGHTNGYGTVGAPGYLRGAVMNGSTDTWDANGDKIPDASQTNAVIFSGDFAGNGDSTYTITSCSDTACSGDGFAAVWVGCGVSTSDECKAGISEGPRLDTDADGVFDTVIGLSGGRNTDHFRIKDIKFTGYNRGNGEATGVTRKKQAPINLNGGSGNADGLKVEHVWMQGNARANTAGETFWALIADMANTGCVDYTEIKDSLLYQENRFLFNSDGSHAPSSGCSWSIHDNKIVLDLVANDWPGNGNAAIAYIKNLDYHSEDNRPYRFRFWNNEVVMKRFTSGWLMDLQHFGNSGGQGKGEVWFYGNLFRNNPGFTAKWNFFYPAFCSEEVTGNYTDSGSVYFFNNTFDGWDGANQTFLNEWCDEAGSSNGDIDKIVEKNNVYIDGTGEDLTVPSTTLIRANEFTNDAKKCFGCSGGGCYFACTGTPSESASSFAYYAPVSGGGIDGVTANTPCDPDGNGSAGVDYNGDGVNDTTWTDIAGNAVSCPTAATALDMGAVQNSGAPAQTCGNNTREGTETCDGTDLNSQTCVSQGFPAGGTLSCNGSCTAFVTTACNPSTCSLYVATAAGGGNDANNGTTSVTPKLTLDAAFALADPGETVCMRAGTYQPTCTVNCGGQLARGTYIQLNRNGASGNPIVIQSYPTEHAIIDGSLIPKDTTVTAGNMGELVRIQGNYITFRDIEVRNSANIGIRTYDPSDSSSTGIIIEDLSVHGNYGPGINLYEGINHIVRRVASYDNADCGAADGPSTTNGNSADGIDTSGGTGHLIYDNESYNNSDDGIDLYGAENVTAYRNIVRNNGRCSAGDGAGMKTGGLTRATGGDNLVFNNLSYDNNKNGFDTYGSGNTKFYHNVSYRNGWDGFSIPCQSDSAPNVFRNNIAWNNAQNNAAMRDFHRIDSSIAADCSPINNVDPICTNNLFNTVSSIADGCATGKVNADPLFMDSVGPTYDFDLNAASPAIDRGYILSSNPDGVTWASQPQLQLDYELVIRPTGAGYDIGAFEEQSGVPSRPATIKGVTLRGAKVQ